MAQSWSWGSQFAVKKIDVNQTEMLFPQFLNNESIETTRNGFLATTESRFSAKLSIKWSKTSWDWLGDQYKKMKLHM